MIKNRKSLTLLVSCLKDTWKITLLVRSHRDKTVPEFADLEVKVIYDTLPPEYETDISDRRSRFQSSYCRWIARGNSYDGAPLPEYDSLIAWDGCSPWGLAAALHMIRAKKRILWVQEEPGLYLTLMDHVFYSELCNGFDAVIAPNVEVKAGLSSLFNERLQGQQNTVRLIEPPIDVVWYREQAGQPAGYEFRTDEVNLLAVCRMSRECGFEQLPRWLSEHQVQYPSLHCYLIGDGTRLDRYLQQIAIYSVDDRMTLLGQIDNPYPYICRCDALLICDEEWQQEQEAAARIFDVTVIRVDEIEQHFSELNALKSRRSQDINLVDAWQDREKLMKILEEG